MENTAFILIHKILYAKICCPTLECNDHDFCDAFFTMDISDIQNQSVPDLQPIYMAHISEGGRDL